MNIDTIVMLSRMRRFEMIQVARLVFFTTVIVIGQIIEESFFVLADGYLGGSHTGKLHHMLYKAF